MQHPFPDAVYLLSKDIDPVALPPKFKPETKLDRRSLKPTKKEQYSGTTRVLVYDHKIDIQGTEKLQFKEYNPTSLNTMLPLLSIL